MAKLWKRGNFALKYWQRRCKHFKVTGKDTKESAVGATTAQLYPGRDTFEFDQEHVTKNQPIAELILSSESLAI